MYPLRALQNPLHSLPPDRIQQRHHHRPTRQFRPSLQKRDVPQAQIEKQKKHHPLRSARSSIPVISVPLCGSTNGAIATSICRSSGARHRRSCRGGVYRLPPRQFPSASTNLLSPRHHPGLPSPIPHQKPLPDKGKQRRRHEHIHRTVRPLPRKKPQGWPRPAKVVRLNHHDP